MLKKHASFFRRVIISLDILLISCAFWVAYSIRFAFNNIPAVEYLYWLGAIHTFLWLLAMFWQEVYQPFRFKRLSTMMLSLTRSAFLVYLVLNAVFYSFKIMDVSRLFVGLMISLSWCLLVLEKCFLMIYFRHLRRKGYNFRNIIIVGTGPRAQQLIQKIRHYPELGLKIIGLVDREPEMVGQEIDGLKVLGTLDDISVILRQQVVDQVICIVPRGWLPDMETLVRNCEILGVRISVAMDLFNLYFARMQEGGLLGLPLITFEPTTTDIFGLIIKRVIDIFVSGLMLLVLGPLLFLVALAIKKDSAGPILFYQNRLGLNGRVFRLYKFRTMVMDAESRLAELREHNEMGGPAFKMSDDPRITSLGKWLRKYSVDELPQLWNVLRGDMSLVGPRPPIPTEVETYDNWHRRRLSMRPGLTCLWQVMGRNKITDFDEWIRLDLRYIDNWSLLLDFKILLKTIPVVLAGSGSK